MKRDIHEDWASVRDEIEDAFSMDGGLIDKISIETSSDPDGGIIAKKGVNVARRRINITVELCRWE